jgi:hypothetical protein
MSKLAPIRLQWTDDGDGGVTANVEVDGIVLMSPDCEWDLDA